MLLLRNTERAHYNLPSERDFCSSPIQRVYRIVIYWVWVLGGPSTCVRGAGVWCLVQDERNTGWRESRTPPTPYLIAAAAAPQPVLEFSPHQAVARWIDPDKWQVWTTDFSPLFLISGWSSGGERQRDDESKLYERRGGVGER